jgi:hypothetical protein
MQEKCREDAGRMQVNAGKIQERCKKNEGRINNRANEKPNARNGKWMIFIFPLYL